MKNIIYGIAMVLVSTSLSPAYAQNMTAEQAKANIDQQTINDLYDFVNTDIVRVSIENQNVKYAALSQDKIDELDKKWRAETKADEMPLISATLSNPLSAYLTRVQARSIGLYSEMFAMDKNGLNVGQSNISSDYWQGDEAKFQKTFPVGPKAVFIDDPEFDDELGIWRGQVNLSVANEAGQAIGAITVELNLSELARRKNPNANVSSEPAACPEPKECKVCEVCPAPAAVSHNDNADNTVEVAQ